MVEIKLYTFCKECNHADLRINEDYIVIMGEEIKNTTISCNHECVCYEIKKHTKEAIK